MAPETYSKATMPTPFQIRDIRTEEHDTLGRLMCEVYASLPGFPTPAEQPGYYDMLAHIGRFTDKPATRVLVAVDQHATVLGGIVYFGDMTQYGSGGSATQETHAAGIRLLGVSHAARGQGIGKALTEACIQCAKDQQQQQVILHTTQAMQTAWHLYERLGFTRSPDLDFLQGTLQVYGFRRPL
ncbi:GNAT family N-acetyltransferase [Leeia oryzae]|uniref:GNAT family N-acetyltransferase n=1 Tax=Leeia oryzae TaxID=356662 RepID=UPI001B7FC853|nr:GNAT family N-acetyltransferase [Leeia oryzae]